MACALFLDQRTDTLGVTNEEHSKEMRVRCSIECWNIAVDYLTLSLCVPPISLLRFCWVPNDNYLIAPKIISVCFGVPSSSICGQIISYLDRKCPIMTLWCC